MPAKLTDADFWSRVQKTDGCWIWNGYRLPRGYGLVGKKYAHRMSYEKAKGSIPDGLFVCHHCDNPSCVNPDHLFLGTNKTNMDDCKAKGRMKGGRPSRLKAQDLHDMRSYCAQGVMRIDVATFFGVDPRYVSSIVLGTYRVKCLEQCEVNQ